MVISLPLSPSRPTRDGPTQSLPGPARAPTALATAPTMFPRPRGDGDIPAVAHEITGSAAADVVDGRHVLIPHALLLELLVEAEDGSLRGVGEVAGAAAAGGEARRGRVRGGRRGAVVGRGCRGGRLARGRRCCRARGGDGTPVDVAGSSATVEGVVGVGVDRGGLDEMVGHCEDVKVRFDLGGDSEQDGLGWWG